MKQDLLETLDSSARTTSYTNAGNSQSNTTASGHNRALLNDDDLNRFNQVLAFTNGGSNRAHITKKEYIQKNRQRGIDWNKVCHNERMILEATGMYQLEFNEDVMRHF